MGRKKLSERELKESFTFRLAPSLIVKMEEIVTEYKLDPEVKINRTQLLESLVEREYEKMKRKRRAAKREERKQQETGEIENVAAQVAIVC